MTPTHGRECVTFHTLIPSSSVLERPAIIITDSTFQVFHDNTSKCLWRLPSDSYTPFIYLHTIYSDNRLETINLKLLQANHTFRVEKF